MASQATALEQPAAATRPALDFDAVRAEFVRAYQPCGPEEMLLVSQIARAWIRLQMYCELEAAVTQKQGLADLLETDLARFNALQRAVSGAERMWRQAIKEFQAARRRSAQCAALASHRPDRSEPSQEVAVPAAPEEHVAAAPSQIAGAPPRRTVPAPSVRPHASPAPLTSYQPPPETAAASDPPAAIR